MANYPLPRDTAAALSGARISNLGLYLNKFIEVDPATWKATEQAKKYEGAPTAVFSAGEGKALLAACAARHRRTLTAAKATTFTASPTNRVIVGLGGKGMLEVGITLHHLYGFPIIPGSALKGLARAYALITLPAAGSDGKNLTPQKLEERVEKYARDKAKAKAERKQFTANPDYDLFLAVFGAQDDAGAAIFFDALPDRVSFEVDIMNVHYPDYYNAKGKNTPPADYYSPTPIDFLTVGKGSRFIFGVAVRHLKGKSDEEHIKLRQQAWKWLKAGLETMGVGAKTTSGYGLFKFDE